MPFRTVRTGAAQDKPAATKAPVLAAEEKVETGEEGERTVFSGDGTLFSFDTGGWRERGRGELRVKVDQSGATSSLGSNPGCGLIQSWMRSDQRIRGYAQRALPAKLCCKHQTI